MKFPCCYCSQPLEAEEDLFGTTLDCPNCGNPITVPLENQIVESDKHEGTGLETAGVKAEKVFSGIAEKVSNASGLEKLEGFSIKKLFSEVFRKHTPSEIEEHFAAGTASTTPELSEVQVGWPTPWAFFRVLTLACLAALGFYWAITIFNNPKLIPGWIFVGCFGMPVAALIFFMEVNVLKNISIYRIVILVVSGGLFSLIISLLLFSLTFLGNWMGSMSAGIIEEIGKLLAVVFFTRKWDRFPWVVNGMLFGAAIGTGFSAFETAGYVFVTLASGGDTEGVMMLRAFLSPMTHTIWTAAVAGALWRVKGSRKFHFSMMKDWRFLRIFLMVMGLHIIWNSPLTIPMLGETVGYFGLRIFLGLVGWLVVLLLLQSGLREVGNAQSKLAGRI